MAAKIRFRNAVSGPYLDEADLPKAGDIVTTLLSEKLSFDVPNAELDDTETKSLTLQEAIQEAFDIVLAAAGEEG